MAPDTADSQQLVAAQPVTSCLSDEDVVAFALGRLPASRLSGAHQHLDTCETCQRLLCEASHALGTAATAPHSESSEVRWNTTFQAGMTVGGRYRIRHFIARGGMGEVYEAFDEELQQRVALKTVTSTACDNSDAVRRLKGEVQLARRVSHRNVCRIYDFGTHLMPQTGEQMSFLTMEFVDGETLGQAVRLGGELPFVEACSFARQLLLGLSAAHDAGVLHRDFKSDNVMLRAEADGRTTPLISDFGLARALDQESQHGSSNSALVGTFDYIAPEQLEGKPHTTASDLYSFGVVWFEMLTGELPFEPGFSPAVAALQRLHRVPPPPSSRNPSLPKAVDAIVLRCLRRAPAERFKKARDILDALDALDALEAPSRVGRRSGSSWSWLLAGAVALGALGYALRPTPSHGIRSTALVRSLNSALTAEGPARPPPVFGSAVGSAQAQAPAPPRPVVSSSAGSKGQHGPPPPGAHSAGQAATMLTRSLLGRASAPTADADADAAAVPPGASVAPSATAASTPPAIPGWENPFKPRRPGE